MNISINKLFTFYINDQKGFNNYLSNILLITLFNGLIWGQKEYNVENLILNGDSYTKKFSEEDQWFHFYNDGRY